MLFRRREEPGYWERFKLWLWPRVSWRRSALYYLKRILRLSGTPYAIAMGAAVGARSRVHAVPRLPPRPHVRRSPGCSAAT